MLETIEQISREFFEKLGVQVNSLEVSEEQDHIYLVKIQSDDSSLLIGPHGRNLETIKTMLKLLASKKTEERIIIHVEVNDYLKEKEEKLYNFIDSKIGLVHKLSKEITLPYLSSYERKKVHSYVAEKDKQIATKSVWEWKDRRMHLYKIEKKVDISIDIDGDDI